MKKIAFVVQRYGGEVNGGAELECRQYAEHLKYRYDIDVLTTKAVDYITWKNEYKADEEFINGVHVRRFPVDKPRNMKEFTRFSARVVGKNASREEEEKWMRLQGPYSGRLLSYIRENKDEYDVFVFFTYLYATTYFGLKEVGKKSVLVPDAHDEKPIYLNIFRDMFKWAGAFFYNSYEEKIFVEKNFGVENIPNNGGLGGVGIEIPKKVSGDAFKKKYNLDKFILYIGRIDEHKGCGELVRYFKEYKKRNESRLKLVFMGKEFMPLEKNDDIISLGFVSEQDKYDGLAACELLVLPSRFESLSIVVLEAMKSKKPVLIHAGCEVVRGHCVRSGGGLYYTKYFEFEGCINYLLEHPDMAEAMGLNGEKYVDENYEWDNLMDRFAQVIQN